MGDAVFLLEVQSILDYRTATRERKIMRLLAFGIVLAAVITVHAT